MVEKSSLLSSVNSPSDIKKLPLSDLDLLAEEIRGEIISTVMKNGGHLASNLGSVELTIAIHRVFNSPDDKIIWDVGHQCYCHKLLTGRKDRFSTLRKMGGISGFPRTDESSHDIINTGHSSTSISVAAGILSGQKIRGIPGKVIAVIGDGALTGGMALEALNFSGTLPDDLIIILNDNDMSISKNVGAISKHLTGITALKSYQFFRKTFDRTLTSVPVIGKPSMNLIRRFKKAFKAVFYRKTIFSDLGYQYIGPVNGHNIKLLVKFLEKVKRLNGPVLLHVMTQKGKGYIKAETNPSVFHGIPPDINSSNDIKTKTFTQVFSKYITEKAGQDSSIAAVTAAMTSGTGLAAFAEKYPDRFFDVGIAEQHAVTFAATLGISGMKPVVALYSTFMQRAVDQIIHDAALSSLPVTIILDRAGLVGGDGETHQGIYDIPLLRSIPGLMILSPACETELKKMLEYSLNTNIPVVIRYPKAECPLSYPGLESDFTPGTGSLGENKDSDILLVSTGSLYSEIYNASILLSESKIYTDTYNIRTIKPLDEKHISEEWSSYSHIFIIEDCASLGGISEYLYRIVSENITDVKCFTRGIPDMFIPHGTRYELLKKCSLDSVSLSDWVKKQLRRDNLFDLVNASNM